MASVPSPQASTGPTIGICVGEDAVRRQVQAALLRGGAGIACSAATVEELLDGLPSGAGETCVVIGSGRPDHATVATAASIKAARDDIAIVLVCGRVSEGEVRRAIDSGIDGIVLGENLETALGLVIAVVLSGQVSVPALGRGELGIQVLTGREKQILRLVVSGLTNKQIAARLFLAESTVKSHLSSAFAKLNVASRNEAVSLILDPDRAPALAEIRGMADRAASPV